MKKKTSLPYLNKKASFKYKLKDKLEVGLSLKGEEVKKIIFGDFDITNSFCFISNKKELTLENFIIGSKIRSIKLLAHKKEILKLELKKKQLNSSIVPFKLYFKFNKIKLEISLGIGKKKFEKKKKLIEKERIKESDKASKIILKRL